MRLPFLGAAVVRRLLLLLPLLLAVSQPAAADSSTPTPAPLWIQSSGQWYGIDGTWSNFAFFAGSPAQVVYLSVATALSETWVIDTGGCVPVQLCIDARGGVFDTTASQTWSSLGSWQLGMNYTGMGGNGDYGLDVLAFTNSVTRTTNAVNGVLIAAINDTDYYEGYLGVGVTQGRFGHNLTNPFISQLAETYDTPIPSHGYGYTAGAYYRTSGTGNSGGTVASLTLGGYDTLRYEPHDTTFNLDPVTRLPNVRLRGITGQVTSIGDAPTKNWTSTDYPLVTFDDSIIAIIDSSTPYLWLPTEVCDRFATALNLTWRDDLGLYVFSDGAQYLHYQSSASSLSFTFSLSSYQDADNFGQPLNTPGVVNVTLPSAAFAQLLKYPFKNVIPWGNSSVPYFPLKRSTTRNNNNQYIIGRAFLQEAYLITSYDRATFSVHQALFPDNAVTNSSLQAITRPVDSSYPAWQGPSTPSQGLNTGQIAGIAISALISGSIIALVCWFCLIRKRKTKQKKEPTGQEEESEEGPQMEEEEEPKSPVKRMFTRIIRKKRSRKPVVHETDGSTVQPVEVGADAQHQVFELPVPPEPVELDSHDVGDEDTDFVVDSTEGMSQYEITRRKLERQLQGPVPTYTPGAYPHPGPGQDKAMQDMSPVAHHRPAEEPSPASSPTYANSNSLPNSLPSPLTPHPDWTNRVFDLPSPLTVAPPHLLPAPRSGSDPSTYSPVSPHSPHSPHTYAPSSLTRSGSNASPTSPTTSIPLPSPTFQRTPIEPSRVVCLGPLPDNVQLPRPQRSIPRIVTPSDPSAQAQGQASPAYLSPDDLPLPQPLGHHHRRSHTQGSTDTLGSNFTVEEEHRLQTDDGPPLSPLEEGGRGSGSGSRGEDHQLQGHDHDTIPRSPRSMERIEAGSELIHVPQVAAKRYSWEGQDEGSISHRRTSNEER